MSLFAAELDNASAPTATAVNSSSFPPRSRTLVQCWRLCCVSAFIPVSPFDTDFCALSEVTDHSLGAGIEVGFFAKGPLFSKVSRETNVRVAEIQSWAYSPETRYLGYGGQP